MGILALMHFFFFSFFFTKKDRSQKETILISLYTIFLSSRMFFLREINFEFHLYKMTREKLVYSKRKLTCQDFLKDKTILKTIFHKLVTELIHQSLPEHANRTRS